MGGWWIGDFLEPDTCASVISFRISHSVPDEQVAGSPLCGV